MSFPPAKRQRSNTSRESVNSTPQTAAPALRQSQVHPSLGLYSPAGYNNAAAAAAAYATQPAAHQNITYGSYAASPVTTTQPNGYAGGYQTSSNPYGASPYSPQQPPNAYAAQYSQPQPSPQLATHGGHYAQPAMNGVQNGAYAQAHASQPAARGTYSPVPASHQTASYHQPQHRGAATPIQHPQHSIPQYGDSYGSHAAPQPTSYHTTAAHYADPTTMSTHYSPAPMSVSQSGSRHISEEPEESDEEDAQGETADESTEVYSNAEPPRQSIPTPSTEHSKPPEHKCACKKGRGKKKACISCVCSKYGLNCTASCSCGNACGNPFADLTMFFGPPNAFPKPCGANACFATWLSNQPNIEELDMDLMVDMLLYDDTSWADISEYTEAFRKWEETWKRARNGKGKKNREERERLEFELLRGGLGNCNPDDFNGFRYSFCQSKWVPMNLLDHCQECRACKSSMEWHCDKHDRCTSNRVCSGCAGTPYQDMMYTDSGA
ncbi:hypothetical protein F5X96DRAFT_617958 [Biscogniauxia mediterranea]|nr:hypothetical protein F5X96DRAFT_617958 [Biscogniauxia mediterranea]